MLCFILSNSNSDSSVIQLIDWQLAKEKSMDACEPEEFLNIILEFAEADLANLLNQLRVSFPMMTSASLLTC
jgi:hypothetical protein